MGIRVMTNEGVGLSTRDATGACTSHKPRPPQDAVHAYARKKKTSPLPYAPSPTLIPTLHLFFTRPHPQPSLPPTSPYTAPYSSPALASTLVSAPHDSLITAPAL